MLVLARRLHERIVIPSILTEVEVIAVRPGFVRLGIDAPPEVIVLREEVYRRATADEQVMALPPGASAEARLAQANHIWRNRLNHLTMGLALLRGQLPAQVPPEALATLRHLEVEAQEMARQLRSLGEDSPQSPLPMPAVPSSLAAGQP